MIRLPSFFKRKTQSDDLELGSRGNRSVKRVAPRSLQRAAEAEELALTEDPEQQRARHRLIGATVLVLLAVIGLPRILDNKPKSAPNDIAVNIVTSLPIPGNDAKSVSKVDDKPKVDIPVVPQKVVPPVAEGNPDIKPEPKSEIKADSKPIPPVTNKNATLGLAAGEEVVASSSTKPKADDSPKTSSNNLGATNTNSPGSSKYVIHIGAFASEERAKGWTAKLKDQKIPYYVSNKTGADGVKLYLLRAGPYTDKDTAEAAEKKIKAMGLSPKLVESGKQ